MGKLCIVDVSQMRGNPALVLSGLILRRIFDHNQEEFTKAQPETIPVIAVVEEAQAVLGSSGSSGEGPYVAWVKEGRKYDLGAVLITQQPGSISNEILSQGDNWFCFHLLSAGDLRAIKSANAHFSDDILSSLLNEPIPGHGVFWSSVAGKSYPIPIRVLSFEAGNESQDPTYSRPAVPTAADELRQRFESALASAQGTIRPDNSPSSKSTRLTPQAPNEVDTPDEAQDALGSYEDAAMRAFENDSTFLARLRSSGVPWRGVQEQLKKAIPEVLSDRSDLAYNLVPRVMDKVFGQQNTGWHTEKRPAKSGGGSTTWIVIGGKPSGS